MREWERVGINPLCFIRSRCATSYSSGIHRKNSIHRNEVRVTTTPAPIEREGSPDTGGVSAKDSESIPSGGAPQIECRSLVCRILQLVALPFHIEPAMGLCLDGRM